MPTPISDLIPINSTTRTIQQCFLNCLYEVPDFQRPYSWDIDELDDYWNDVVLAHGDFFFGATVTWESESRELFNNSYSIIDGQQRLTTSAIILSVVRDFFREIGASLVEASAEHETDAAKSSESLQQQCEIQANNTQRYLIATDDDGRRYPVIRRAEPNFREVVQNPSAIPSGVAWNSSARQIGTARTFFETKVKDALGDDGPAELVATLKGIRDNVLKARVIQVELASEEDGFLIFETLNTRGSELRLADLVKNLLVRGGATQSDDRRTIAERWDRVANRVQGISESANAVDQFMWQSWNSRRAAVTEAELYKKIIEMVSDNADLHLAYLEELEYDSLTYQYIEDIDLIIDTAVLSTKSALKFPEVADTLRALALFNVSVANSALLAIVRKYEQTSLLRKRDLFRTCRAIENFHFQFTALRNSGSTGGTRGRYNRFAVELEGATSRAEVTTALNSFTAKLSGSLPSATEAKKAFCGLFYAPAVRLTNAQKRRGRKQFVSYVLLRFAQEHQVLPAGQSLSSWTIEHIRPQRLASGHVTDSELSIGNLALLTSGANGVLGDRTFDEKREGLARWVPWADEVMQSWLDDDTKVKVNSADIAERAEALAKVAVSTVWSILP